MDSVYAIQGSRDQHSFDSFPGLIAVFHALHRLLAPRHPPHALSSLAALIVSSAGAPASVRSHQLPSPDHSFEQPGEKVTILTLSKGSCRDSKETAKRPRTMQALPKAPCALVNCNSYRYPIVKELPPKNNEAKPNRFGPSPHWMWVRAYGLVGK